MQPYAVIIFDPETGDQLGDVQYVIANSDEGARLKAVANAVSEQVLDPTNVEDYKVGLIPFR